MTKPRRFTIAPAAAGAADLPSRADAARDADSEVARLARRSEEANGALMRGDADRYCALVRLAEDFTLMSPFGGAPTHPTDTETFRRQLGQFFRNGTFAMELVQAWRTTDMIVLAVIERTHVEVGGRPAQDWALRVTLVYHREGDEWRLAHRHADPLAHGISVEQAAALARGGHA